MRSELHDAANEIWELWRRRHEETLKTENCADLVKGKENPIAVEALKNLAGSDEIRKGLIKELDVQIKNVYEEIRDVDKRSDDGASELQDAQRAVEEIQRLLDKLRYARGEEEEAKRITDYWPDKVRSLREALAALKKLKAGQHLIDRGVEVCNQAEAGLRELIQREMADKDEKLEGWTRIDEKAKQLAETFSAKLKTAEDHRPDMESWKGEATRWSAPEGRRRDAPVPRQEAARRSAARRSDASDRRQAVPRSAACRGAEADLLTES